eukprot:MONOS_7418.1-p1 / transcript=MONOS_7418.1 / gene=MONOS_7418 / organism=Monocercomonoides_exilis_PA203 / gene_product=unspecified product / transcript_product=unspecified product / location=Mono_scaffold00252:72116-73561(-) / protein_length=360 / sequence_SO=supercontig / SO=protein_coding / is_pseudo=false
MILLVLFISKAASELQLDAVDSASREYAQETLELSYKRHIPEFYLQHCLSGPLNTLLFDYEQPRFIPPPPTSYEIIAPMEISSCEEKQIKPLSHCLTNRGAICKETCLGLTQDQNELQTCLRLCQANVLSSCPIGEATPKLMKAWAGEIISGNCSIFTETRTSLLKRPRRTGLMRPSGKRTAAEKWKLNNLDADAIFTNGCGDLFPCFHWGLCGSPTRTRPRLNSPLCTAGLRSDNPNKDIIDRVTALDLEPFENEQKECIDRMFTECDLECGMDQTCINKCSSHKIASCIVNTLVHIRDKILINPSLVCVNANKQKQVLNSPVPTYSSYSSHHSYPMKDLVYWTSTPGGRPSRSRKSI